MSGRRKLLSSEIGEISSSHLLLRFSRGPNGPPNSSDLSSAQHGIFSVGGLPGKASLAASSRCASKALNHEKMLVKAGPEGGGECSPSPLLFHFRTFTPPLNGSFKVRSGSVERQDNVWSQSSAGAPAKPFPFSGGGRILHHVWKLVCFQAQVMDKVEPARV